MKVVKEIVSKSLRVVILLAIVIIYGHTISVNAETISDVGITYQAHVQNIGWQGLVNSGENAGTTGRSLAVEALKMNLTTPKTGMYITYQTHIANIGWQTEVQDGQQAGTTGKDLAMQAIKIQLHNAQGYHVQYQVHVENLGWMDWVQDGQQAGTTGKNLRIEAIRIKIVKDDSVAPQAANITSLYQADVENIGWQNWSSDGAISGTTGKSLLIDAIKIGTQNAPVGMNIKYQVHVGNIGWMSWVENGQEAGTTGQNLGIQAIKIQLDGVTGYHVEYQVHVDNIGWMPWSEDGQIAGTTGRNLNVQAIRIKIVKDQVHNVVTKSAITSPVNASSFINNQSVNLTGYSLNQYGNQEVDVYVDGSLSGAATMGLNSSSVGGNGYVDGNISGYSYKLPISIMGNGTHTVTVQAIGKDLSLDGQSVSINVKVLNPAICIDGPQDGTFINTQTGVMDIKGWALNSFGVSAVQIYVNSTHVSDATIGILRTDVNNIYPNYIGGSNSGFDYSLNYASIPNGVNTITVNSIGNDGIVTSQSIKIYKFASNNQYGTNYSNTLSQAVNTQMNYGQPVMASNWQWVSADSNTVRHYVDPTNFMDNYGIYQFLRLDYMQGVTVADLNSILAGKGVLNNKGSQFLAAAQQSNINPIYLVSHALLESGNGTSQLATGVVVNGRTTYNLFGIGAYDSNPITMGAQYAFDQGWFSVDQAIAGGANWISSQYINNGNYKQNTLYKMRWNPASPGNHQYATDVSWAYSQISNIKKLVNMVQNPSLQFDIPIYKN
ncbi:glucosaminidase domain-containing protein [Clostridium akagii]|uniref:glucosaminidase domain-containing protein n=1 Tax=Clostridium akagii TaxID=91623 RepID=UPI00047C938D|nr:glucosaminidase domain-containing protein [Clostridium akagii]